MRIFKVPYVGERNSLLLAEPPGLFFRVQSKREIVNYLQERASSRNVALMPGRFS